VTALDGVAAPALVARDIGVRTVGAEGLDVRSWVRTGPKARRLEEDRGEVLMAMETHGSLTQPVSTGSGFDWSSQG
jgi:hypothetical protein